MSQNILNLDNVSRPSFSKRPLSTPDSAELVLFDLLFFFQKHSFPLDSFFQLLFSSQTRLFVIHQYIISFLTSHNLSFSDSFFLDNLSFLEANGFLPCPTDIPELFTLASSIWRSLS